MQEWKVRVCRPLTDAEPCLEIYRPYVEQTAITFEYTVPSVTEFQHRMEHTLKRYPYLVIEKDGKIGGYAYASPFKERAAYAYSVELSIYLDMSLRHQGLGKQLYICLEDVLKLMGVCNVNACIGVPREGEELPFLDGSSAAFHTHLGYQMVGRFHSCGYKFASWLDMVWMEKMIQPHSQHPEPFRTFTEIRLQAAQQFDIQWLRKPGKHG
ncbi:MAG TPA: GNAT family N-acetyltransferase [Erysipelotrichaceae bacterium]|nr:GNAT family N-acetyltransferase [Erysipelotrichaceae bacterium]